jgi:hypothetical protein
MGPNTTAPDTAPSAASVARSAAIAVDESSDKPSASIAVARFISNLPVAASNIGECGEKSTNRG